MPDKKQTNKKNTPKVLKISFLLNTIFGVFLIILSIITLMRGGIQVIVSLIAVAITLWFIVGSVGALLLKNWARMTLFVCNSIYILSSVIGFLIFLFGYIGKNSNAMESSGSAISLGVIFLFAAFFIFEIILLLKYKNEFVD